MKEDAQLRNRRIAPACLAIAIAVLFGSTWTGCADDKREDPCEPVESLTINGRIYCVASAEERDDGYRCPDTTTAIDFGDVLVCSPVESPPDEDLEELYEAAIARGGEGDPLDVCTGPNPAEEPDCTAHTDCPVGQFCRFEADSCFPSSCTCSGPDLWTCTSDCRLGGSCQTGDPCADDSDCAAREICRNGACLLDTSCTTDSD